MRKALRLVAVGVAGVALCLAFAWVWVTHRGVISSADNPIPECRHHLAPDIAALVRPVLVESQRWDPDYDTLEALLADKSPKSLEARVALRAYHLGAHPSEELDESLVLQEQEATRLVRRYLECRPPLETEWLIGTLHAGRGGYEAYFELLKESRLTTR